MKAFIDYFETSVATREDKHSYESNTSSAFYLSIPFHKFLSYEKKKKKWRNVKNLLQNLPVFSTLFIQRIIIFLFALSIGIFRE